jgi:hypothetical protein
VKATFCWRVLAEAAGVSCLVFGFVMLSLTIAAPGEGARVRQCIEASEAAQAARRSGDTKEALTLFRRCSATECPALIAADCGKAVSVLERMVVNLKVLVVDEQGLPVPEAVVTVNGTTLRGSVELVPGEYTVAAESTAQRVEKRVKLRAGPRTVRLVLAIPAPTPTSDVPLAEPTPKVQPEETRPLTSTSEVGESEPVTTPKADEPKPLRAGPLILGSTSVVALGIAVALGVNGFGEYQKLAAEPCAMTRTCDPAREAPIRTQILIVDISLILALLTGAGAVVWAVVP